MKGVLLKGTLSRESSSIFNAIIESVRRDLWESSSLTPLLQEVPYSRLYICDKHIVLIVAALLSLNSCSLGYK